jgi:predicted ferric reductase
MLRDKRKEIVLKSVYFLLFILGSVLVYFSNSRGVDFTYFDIGQVFGVWALTALTIQLILITRLKPLEKDVGLPLIMNWHSFNAKFLFFLVALHPLLIFSRQLLSGISFFALAKNFPFAYWLGESAFLLLILVLVTTLYSRKLSIDYEKWKILHKMTYTVATLGFIHSFFSGSDIWYSTFITPVYFWWIVLALVASIAATYRFFRIYFNFGKYNFKVSDTKRETRDVHSIYLKPARGKVFDFKPGQFAFVKFISENVSSEEHHFTISSAPNKKYINFTIKDVGDFTSKIGRIKKGDRAIVDGPFGVFTYKNIKGPLLLIAGGIGITPIKAMLSDIENKSKKRDCVLIYAVKSPKDLVFRKELERMSTKNWLKTVYVFSESKGDFKSVYKGHVSKKIVKKEVKDLKKRSVFLVGPPEMMESVKKILAELGVSSEKIYIEKFALR